MKIKAIVPVDDQDEEIFRRRVQGEGERVIARSLGITPRDVRAAILRVVPTLDAEARRAELAIELVRLDALVRVFHAMALGGDIAGASIFLRLSERRACLLGHDVAPARIGDVVINVAPTPRESSTDRIKRALDMVAGRTIEGTVVRSESSAPVN